MSEKHKSLSGKQRINDGDLEIFICDDYCTHELWSIYVPSKTPDCFGDYYSLTYIQKLIKGETKPFITAAQVEQMADEMLEE